MILVISRKTVLTFCSSGDASLRVTGHSQYNAPGLNMVRRVRKKINGPSGNRTRVLGFEAQEDVLYPMDPALAYCNRNLLSIFLPTE